VIERVVPPGLARLAYVLLKAIAEAAGCSKASASDIRRGKQTPHASRWMALASLVFRAENAAQTEGNPVARRTRPARHRGSPSWC
jgi:hypothetical protein